MAHGLTSQLPQSSYIFRVHPWLLRAEISIQASDMRLSLKIAQKGLNEQKKNPALPASLLRHQRTADATQKSVTK